MKSFVYFACLEPGEQRGVVVTFPDVPEAITEADALCRDAPDLASVPENCAAAAKGARACRIASPSFCRNAGIRSGLGATAEPGMTMRGMLAVLVMVLLALPAYAQRMGGKDHRSKEDQSQGAEQKEKKRKDEEAYKRALKSIPDKPAPTDPWKNVR